MISLLRNRLGVPGLIAIIALVFAMVGGAIASGGNGGDQNATASAKAKQGPRGPKGPKGPVGSAGPQGPAGANGKDGASGTNGEDGGAGPTGATGARGPTGSGGLAGPTGPTGATGVTGPEGSPWTVGGTLPSGKTETGTWSMGTLAAGAVPSFGSPSLVPISFPIPLATPLSGANCEAASEDPCKVHLIFPNGKEKDFQLQERTSATCLGNVEAPTAVADNLCIYISAETGLITNLGANILIVRPSEPGLFAAGADKSGAILQLFAETEGAKAFGTWAVTAP